MNPGNDSTLPLRSSEDPVPPFEASSGFVIIGDIVGFSEKVNDDQRSLVKHLWRFLNSREELATKGHHAILNGTGDGALVAFPRVSDSKFNDGEIFHWEKAVLLAEKWIEWMRRGSEVDGQQAPPCELRVGIHQGPFQIVNVAELGGLARHGGFQVVGIAPNLCARVAGLGDGGDIVVSEEFVQNWKAMSNVNNAAFDPNLANEPFSAFVKHGRPLQIRLMRRKGVPKKLAFAGLVSNHLVRLLQEVETDLLDAVLDYHPENGAPSPASGKAESLFSRFRAELSARMTIWVPDKTGKFLECTDYRWHYQDTATKRGKTKYSIESGGNGVPGQSFAGRKPSFVHKLPVVDKESDKSISNYCERLGGLTALDPAIVRHFSRYAGAFIAIPAGLDPHNPDCLMCIDTAHNLGFLGRSDLSTIVEYLSGIHGTRLASLWRMRLS